MIMELSHRIEENICFLNMKGDLMAGVSKEVDEYLQSVVRNETIQGIICNLEGVNYIDSSGIGVITKTYRELRKKDSQIYLCCVADTVYKLLDLCAITKFIQIFPSESEAMNALTS